MMARKLRCEIDTRVFSSEVCRPHKRPGPTEPTGGDMKTNRQRAMSLGDLIAGAFDEAARHSNDSAEVSRAAVQAVVDMMRPASRYEREVPDPTFTDPTSRRP